jgi:hypothetical protein
MDAGRLAKVLVRAFVDGAKANAAAAPPRPTRVIDVVQPRE